MPEGPNFNWKVLPSDPTPLSQPQSESPQPPRVSRSISVTIASVSEPRNKMRKDSVAHLHSNVLNGGEVIVPPVAERTRRGSGRWPSNPISGKKVSFTEKPANDSEAALNGGAPARQASVPRTQSHRELKNTASVAAVHHKYGAKRSASFREGLRQGESYQVLMLGAVGVGKSSLVQQFQDSNDGHVSIKVSNVYGDNCRRANDAQLTIVDNPAIEITAEMAIACCDADAYVIVYSVTDRESFVTAEQILQAICVQENCNNKAAILVGNKVDLVRRRVVNTEEGKACATLYGCKFIETSDWIDYNVDELFEGVLAQIRLRLEAPAAKGKKREKRGYRRSKTLGTKSWGMLKDFINKINRKVKSCDDLHVL